MAPSSRRWLPTAKPHDDPAGDRARVAVSTTRAGPACRSSGRSRPRAGQSPGGRPRRAGTRRCAPGTRSGVPAAVSESTVASSTSAAAASTPSLQNVGRSARATPLAGPVSRGDVREQREVESDEPARAVLAASANPRRETTSIIPISISSKSGLPAATAPCSIRRARPFDVRRGQADVEQDAIGDRAGQLQRGAPVTPR